jgi:hypothetical protein
MLLHRFVTCEPLPRWLRAGGPEPIRTFAGEDGGAMRGNGPVFEPLGGVGPRCGAFACPGRVRR